MYLLIDKTKAGKNCILYAIFAYFNVIKSINQRIKIIREYFCNNSNQSFADKLEVSKQVANSYVRNGYSVGKTVFVITTCDGNVLKQITEINKGERYILCHSWNKDFDDFKISFDDIYQIFTVCKVVQKQISLV